MMSSRAQLNTASRERVSVVVCTRNRGGNLLPTVTSILAQTYGDFELLILDQSDDDSTERALDSLPPDPRLCYHRLELPGKPLAQNHALKLMTTSLMIVTDDDCEAAPDWLEAICAAFEVDPKVGCLFGDVAAAPHDPDKGFIPYNHIPQDKTIAKLWDFLRMPGLKNFGIGANLAVRRDAMEAMGGFDPCIGPGAKYGYADDHDLAVRMLLAGWHVHFSSRARIVHYGFREWRHNAEDVRRTGFGFGATFAKYLRCGKIYWGSLRMLGYFFAQIMWRAVRFKRPLGVAFPRGYFPGLVAGMRQPLDRSTRCFQPTGTEEILRYGSNISKVVLRTEQTDPSINPVEAEAENAPPTGVR
jgi:GT2 family glycosyltransferase